MKLTNLIKLSALSLFALLVSCGDKNSEQHHENDGHDHSGHDHSSHAGKPHTEEAHTDHTDHDDHENCGVAVGPNGGRMIKDFAELNLDADGRLILIFNDTAPTITRVAFLVDSSPVKVTQDGKMYTSVAIADQLPAEVHVSIKGENLRHVEAINVKAGNCKECKQTKLACTCHNH